MNERCRLLIELGGLAVVLLLPSLFNPWSPWPFDTIKVALFQIVTAMILLAGVVGLLGHHRRPGQTGPPTASAVWARLQASSPLARPILSYAAIVILATVGSIDAATSLWGTPTRPGAITILGALSFALLLASALRTTAQADRLMRALVAGSVPVSVYGVLQYLGADPLPWTTDSVSRVLSTMGRSNFLAAYLAMIAPFTLARVAVSRDRGESMRYGAVFLLQVTCLALTLARAGWLAFIVATVGFLGLLAYRWPSRRLWGLVLVVILAGATWPRTINPLVASGMAPAAVDENRSPSFAQLREASIDARRLIWSTSLQLVRPRWLLGYGPASFAVVFAGHRPAGLDCFLAPGTPVDDPHNLVLNQLMSTGVMGLLVLAWIVVSFYGQMLRRVARASDRAVTVTAAAVLASATAFLIHAQFSPSGIVLLAFFWLVLALGGAAAERDGRSAGQGLGH
jgi:O-antigen ligase